MSSDNSLAGLDMPDSVAAAYEVYRKASQKGWGLAWYLSNELCRRFYVSHGIVPYVLEHSGLGYYGIGVYELPCAVNRRAGPCTSPLGRFSMAGEVENWRTSRFSHDDSLVDRAYGHEKLSVLVQDAIRYLELSPVPSAPHSRCHHKRRGESFVLLWEMAALIALRREGSVCIWNHPFHTEDLAKRHDPDYASLIEKGEPPGYFLFESGTTRVFIRGDGRVILPVSSGSLWERYMRGESVTDLALWIEQVR